MSRSYHITRKQANKAMDSGDMNPTWQASEKAWVKKASDKKRTLSKALPNRAKTPNRVIVAREKRRTLEAKIGSPVEEKLDRILAAKKEPNQSPEPMHMLVTPTASHSSRQAYASAHL